MFYRVVHLDTWRCLHELPVPLCRTAGKEGRCVPIFRLETGLIGLTRPLGCCSVPPGAERDRRILSLTACCLVWVSPPSSVSSTLDRCLGYIFDGGENPIVNMSPWTG